MKRWRVLLAATLVGCAAPSPEQSLDGTIVGEPGDKRNRARLRTELATLYYNNGNVPVALEELRAATAADADYGPAHGMYGVIYMRLNEQAKAAESFERAMRLSPNDPDINHNYGWFLCQTGREQASIKYFMSAARNPLYPAPWRSYAAAGTCSSISWTCSRACAVVARCSRRVSIHFTGRRSRRARMASTISSG